MVDSDRTTDDRALGALWGLACGDALGRPVEFRSPAAIENRHGELAEMVGNGTWGKPAGTVTDDTDLALCLARSLAERGEWDPGDVGERFVQWLDGDPFDVGRMTRKSIRRLADGDDWATAGRRVWEDSPEGSNAGNGSVMRCAPLAVAFADDPDRLAAVSRESSLGTHADPRCTHGCALLNLTVAGYLAGAENPLAGALDRVRGAAPGELVAALGGLPASADPAALETTPYVVTTLQTALYDALDADSFERAVVRAVNRGGDADTVGVVAGAVAGARFGAADVPERWLGAVDEREELAALAGELVDLRAGDPVAP
jgi:ADP-ribosyl-[dinitrogen reductase] hydrolase